jgi:hypothetical protein
MPLSRIDIDQGGTASCSLMQSMFFGHVMNASSCPELMFDGNSTVSGALTVFGRECCAGSRLNLVCGSPAPTPPPTVAIPRVGPTYACGGSIQGWRTSTAGGATCTGVPFINETLLGGVCGSYNGTDRTEYGFTLSNGGACVSFYTLQSCNAAVSNLSLILSTASADLVSLGSDGAGNCFLRQTGTGCASYPSSGLSVTMTPQCSTTASPTLAPTLSPASTSSNSGSSGTGTHLSETVAIIIAVTLVIVFIGIAVYGYQRHASIVKNRDEVLNPMYEVP